MERIRVGVIGAGTWGRLHARVYAGDARVELVAIADLDLARAQAVAQECNADRAYASWEALLEQSGIEALSIATPDFAHTEIAIAAAEAGVNLLVEKPLALTPGDCARVIEAARRAGVRLMVDFHNRWSPPFYQLKQALDTGELGEPKSLDFRLNDTIYVPTKYLPWAGRSSVLWFLGSHVLDTLRWLLDDEVSHVYAVKGEGVLTGQGITTADFYKYILRFHKGAVASVENNWILPEAERNIFNLKFSLIGSKGSYYINSSDAGVAEKYTTGPSCPDVLGDIVIHGRRVGFMSASITHFIDCLIEGREPLVTGQDGLEATRVIMAIEESAETGMPLSLKDFGGA